MSDPKEPADSFFRKVVRFVANPTTDWANLNSRQDDGRELDLEKSELKAMIERKRRNDFVRKREFDMLRKVRREGLTPEQLAALGTSSRLDDSEARLTDNMTRKESGVKAKIDVIEREMVGDHSAFRHGARPSGFFEQPTEPGVLSRPDGLPSNTRQGGMGAERGAGIRRRPGSAPLQDPDALPALPPLPDFDVTDDATLAPPASAPVTMAAGLGPLAVPRPSARASGEPGGNFAATPREPAEGLSSGNRQAQPPAPNQPWRKTDVVQLEVSEIVLDPDLDEAVIAFANADFTQCEKSIQQLIGLHGRRQDQGETWLVMFDLYRATGQHERYESLALDFSQRFGSSAPQWFSLPQMVADAVALETPRSLGVDGNVGWSCPELLDAEGVSRLRSLTLQLPLPWVFDWSALREMDAETATHLSALFRYWATQPIEIQWLGTERLLTVLTEAAPTGVRDADPSFWLTRLDTLRLANRVDHFDEVAIDYCVTYEVSPPSWEPARCTVQLRQSGGNTRTPALSLVGEASTSFVESSLFDADVHGTGATLELSGQLVGDIGATLEKLDTQLRDTSVITISCTRLIRVDFVAAGDLLNWVLAKRQEKRSLQFVDAHRLVALFFGAMGINEHAKVHVRRV